MSEEAKLQVREQTCFIKKPETGNDSWLACDLFQRRYRECETHRAKLICFLASQSNPSLGSEPRCWDSAQAYLHWCCYCFDNHSPLEKTFRILTVVMQNGTKTIRSTMRLSWNVPKSYNARQTKSIIDEYVLSCRRMIKDRFSASSSVIPLGRRKETVKLLLIYTVWNLLLISHRLQPSGLFHFTLRNKVALMPAHVVYRENTVYVKVLYIKICRKNRGKRR